MVQEKIKDACLIRLKEKAEAIVLSAPDDMATEVGPLCSSKDEELIAKSLKQGAKLITGGTP